MTNLRNMCKTLLLFLIQYMKIFSHFTGIFLRNLSIKPGKFLR